MYLQQISPVGVAQITASNFGGHVPTTERGGRELDSAAIEHHVGDGGQRVPAETHFSEPGISVGADGEEDEREVD